MEGYTCVTLICVTALLFFSPSYAQSPVGDTNLDAPLEKPIALYDESDQVVELFDETINSIHNSEYIWVVEFYAHW